MCFYEMIIRRHIVVERMFFKSGKQATRFDIMYYYYYYYKTATTIKGKKMEHKNNERWRIEANGANHWQCLLWNR